MISTDTAHQTFRRGRSIVLVVALAVAALVVAVAWYVLRPAPAAVDITAAADAIATTDDAGDTSTASPDVDGTWNVDTTIGTFSVTDSAGTFVGFRIDEELASIGATEAIGRTPDVTGSLTLDGSTLTEANFTADLTGIVSDEAMREDDIQEALRTRPAPTPRSCSSTPSSSDRCPRRGRPSTSMPPER